MKDGAPIFSSFLQWFVEIMLRPGDLANVNEWKIRFDPSIILLHMSNIKRKPAFCICANKDTEQLWGYS